MSFAIADNHSLTAPLQALLLAIMTADAYEFCDSPVLTSWESAIDPEAISATRPADVALVSEWAADGVDVQRTVTVGQLLQAMENLIVAPAQSDQAPALTFASETGPVTLSVFSLSPVDLSRYGAGA